MKNKYIKKLIELEELENSPVQIEISHRGGNYAIPAATALQIIGVEYDKIEELESCLPEKIGAGCNYLGGGIRGAVFGTADSPAEFVRHGVPKKVADELYNLGLAIIDRYIQIENGMNDEEDENGEINWDAKATNASRRAGVRSAY